MNILDIIKDWPGSISINGKEYPNINTCLEMFNGDLTSGFDIKLYSPLNKINPSTPEHLQKDIYKIHVKKYMTQKSNPGFDFMEKRNNNIPMPYTVMTGTIEDETSGMVYMKLSRNNESWEGWIIKSAIIDYEKLQ